MLHIKYEHKNVRNTIQMHESLIVSNIKISLSKSKSESNLKKKTQQQTKQTKTNIPPGL